jgi:general nucleoside transport system permease protein
MTEVLSVVQYAMPVALAAMGESVAQKSGVMQIGLEGIMLGAAYAGAIVTLTTGNPLLGLAAGVVTGLVMAMVSAAFCLVGRADQVVVGTALNLLALGVTGSLFRIQFAGQGLPNFPRLGGGGSVDFVMVFGLLSAPLLFWVLRRSAWGLAVRGAGEYPKAVEASGFRVLRLRFQAMILGGMLAGLAGAYLSVGIAGSFADNMSNGRGFLAIAMVTFGRWNPIGVLVASLLVGLAESLQFTLQAKGIGLPYQLMLALPYLLALGVLIVAGKGTRGPAGLGTAYRRDA